MPKGGLAIAVPLLLVLVLSALVPACIIPLGPEWQDPLAAENTPPIIKSSAPQLHSVHVAQAPGGTKFSIRVSDGNIGDTLHVRFLADYPPFDAQRTRLLQPFVFPPRDDGQRLDEEAWVVPDCDEHELLPTIPTHQIYVVVADREFVGSLAQPHALKDNKGYVLTGGWTLELDCPQ